MNTQKDLRKLTRQELLESISLFYRVFYLHETFEEADGESKEQ